MCLAVPGRIEEIFDRDGIRMAKVDFGGLRKEVCLVYLPEIAIGDYALVHVGFAISRLDEQSARETLESLEALQAQRVTDEERDRCDT